MFSLDKATSFAPYGPAHRRCSWLALLAVIACFPLQSVKGDISTDLVGHWKLNETSGVSAADTSGLGRTGTYIDSPLLGQAGISGTAVRFNGTSQYVTIPDHADFSSHNKSALSVSAWVKVITVNTDKHGQVRQPIVVKGNTNAWEWALYVYDNGAAGASFWQQGGSSHTEITGGAIAPGTWVHVCMTYQKGDANRLYVNGKQVAIGTYFGGSSYDGVRPVRIASREDGQYLNADVDDVRIFKRKLSSADVQELYALRLHLKLDETSGTTIADASPFENNGTISGDYVLGDPGVRQLATTLNATGTSGKISLPSGTISGLTDITTTFWIKTLKTGRQSIVSAANSSRDNEFVVYFASSTSLYIYYQGGSASWKVPSIADGSWHHFAVVTNSSANQTTVYLDNISQGAKSISPKGTALTVGSGGLFVGQEQDCLGGCFDLSQIVSGSLDDLRIYAKALSTAEVSEIYGLIGHWKFNEGSGTTAADSSGKDNPAILFGANWTKECNGNIGVEFDGRGGTASTKASFDPPATGAVSVWLRSAGNPGSRSRPFGVGGDWEMRQEPDGTLSFDLGGEGPPEFVTSEGLSFEDRWYHVVAQFDDSNNAFEVYLDGDLVKSGINSTKMTKQLADTLTFGTRTGNKEFWAGAMRDFRVYDRWMTDSEISQAAGIIAHWRFDELSGKVAIDSSTASNDAAYVGSPQLGVPSSNLEKNGTAVELNGTSQYMTAGKSLLNNLSTFSLSGWFRPDDTTPNISLFGQNGLIELGIDSASNQIDLWTSKGGSVVTTGKLPLSKWSHIAVVGDGNGLRIYLNGNEVASGGVPASNYGSNTSSFQIGEGVLIPSGDFYDGRVDDVRVFSRALCSEEVQSLYKGGQTKGLRIIRWLEVR